MTDDDVTQKSASEQHATEGSLTDAYESETYATGKSVTEEPVKERSVAGKHATDNSTVGDSVSVKYALGESPIETCVIEDSVTRQLYKRKSRIRPVCTGISCNEQLCTTFCNKNRKPGTILYAKNL